MNPEFDPINFAEQLGLEPPVFVGDINIFDPENILTLAQQRRKEFESTLLEIQDLPEVN